MKEEETQDDAVEIWQPREFAGNDLLPVNQATLDVPDIPLVGDENIDNHDMVLPALVLLHGTSQAVTDGVEDAEPGRFMHTGTEEVLPPGPVRLLVVHYYKGCALFPKNEPRYQGLKTCISRDGIEGSEYGACADCGRCFWPEHGGLPLDGADSPLGGEVHHFICLTSLGPVMLRLTKSTFKAGSKFLTAKKMAGKNFFAHPVVVRVIQLPKTLPTGKVTSYYALQMAWQTTERVPDDLQREAYRLYKEVSQKHELGHLKSNDESNSDFE
jgi:hypothetical protein